MSRKPERKRARLPRTVDFARSFVKDWERLNRSGRYDMRLLKEAMILLIANDEPLGAEWSDHALKGDWTGFRECHIGGDFLLIYEVADDVGSGGTIVFNRAGTHSELFRK